MGRVDNRTIFITIHRESRREQRERKWIFNKAKLNLFLNLCEQESVGIDLRQHIEIVNQKLTGSLESSSRQFREVRVKIEIKQQNN